MNNLSRRRRRSSSRNRLVLSSSRRDKNANSSIARSSLPPPPPPRQHEQQVLLLAVSCCIFLGVLSYQPSLSASLTFLPPPTTATTSSVINNPRSSSDEVVMSPSTFFRGSSLPASLAVVASAASAAMSSQLASVTAPTAAAPSGASTSTPTTAATTKGDHPRGSENNDSDSGTVKKKTVYLVRHAESEENKLYRGPRAAYAALKAGKLPNLKDAFETVRLPFLMFREKVVDSPVSLHGSYQIRQLHERYFENSQTRQLIADAAIKASRAAKNNNNKDGEESLPVVVAHSPLQRAKVTAYGGVLGREEFMSVVDVAPDATESDPASATTVGKQPNNVVRKIGERPLPLPKTDPIPPFVYELKCLKEINPQEIVLGYATFTGKKQLDNRIAAFEEWIESRPESTIVAVGHSVFFNRMLGVPDGTIGNCDVWQLTYDKSKALHQQFPPPIIDQMMADTTDDVNLPRAWSQMKQLYKGVDYYEVDGEHEPLKEE